MSVAVSTGVALSAAALGAGATIYGASQQRVAQNKATDANVTSVAKADNSAWNNYLLQKGLYTGGSAPTGTIPGMTPGAAVNTKLPFWANMPTGPAASTNPLLNTTAPGAGAGSTWVRRGASPFTQPVPGPNPFQAT